MGNQVKVDRVALHRYLHRKLRGRAGPIDKVKLGEQLGVTPPHLGRIIAELVDAERLVFVGRRKHNVAVYRSVDPEKFGDELYSKAEVEPPPEAKPERRQRALVWG